MSRVQEQLSDEIVERLARIDAPTREDVNRVKMEVCRELHSPTIPANTDLLERVPASFLSRLKPLLTEKRVRGISGVTIVALMPKPWACPHGKCTYCPGGPEIGVPRAYTGKEPVAMRAMESKYDPYGQVKSRLSQLMAMGHVPDKIELILVGGTFSFLPEDYQERFIKSSLDALNGIESHSLDEAKILAETAKTRNVGITVETRPDWSRRAHVDHMLSLGVTRVEIGVQTLHDDVYQRIHREHTVRDVIDATQTLKDSALKVGYHMMPGLPGSNHDRDLEAFRRMFEDPDFRPDMLKIYPCLVTPGTQLYEQWQRGEYKPYSTEESAKLIAEVKMFVPPWVRIMRIQREIPAYNIADGVKKGNLRQLVEAELEKRGGRCRCIRCREAGHVFLKDRSWPDTDQIKLNRITYEGSGGEDIFLSYEDPLQDVLIGYLRLRIPGSTPHRPEISGQHTGLVREVHVFGQTVAVGDRMDAAFQHKGFGSGLLMEAERIAVEEYDCRKMVIISALGTKAYYARFGYEKDGPYVSKQISRISHLD